MVALGLEVDAQVLQAHVDELRRGSMLDESGGTTTSLRDHMDTSAGLGAWNKGLAAQPGGARQPGLEAQPGQRTDPRRGIFATEQEQQRPIWQQQPSPEARHKPSLQAQPGYRIQKEEDSRERALTSSEVAMLRPSRGPRPA